MKKRGTQTISQPRSRDVDLIAGEHASLLLQLTSPQVNAAPRAHDEGSENFGSRKGLAFSFDLSEQHQMLVQKNLSKIQDLVTVYFEVVYPM